jgi:putative chitinase
MADRVVPALDAAMQRFEIASPARMAAFLAQLAHESGELRHWTENLNYGWQGLRKTFSKYFRTDADARAYERKPERIANRVYGGRMGNGPESSGDGWRYRGRGPIQLTGKQNYQACGTAIGVDLVNAPERLETPEVGCLAAAWFWASKGLNALADAGDFVTITKRINGGTIGLEERKAFWNRAKALFGVTAPAAAAPRTVGARGGVAILERAEKPAAAARKKPAKPRVTAKAKAGAKAGKARAASTKKSARKATTPRVAAAKQAETKVAKPRSAATKKAGVKAATTRVAAGKKAAAKTTKPRVTAAKKAGTKAAKPRVAAATKAGPKAGKPRAAATGKLATRAERSRAATARKTRAKAATGKARAKASKKVVRKTVAPRAVGPTLH